MSAVLLAVAALTAPQQTVKPESNRSAVQRGDEARVPATSRIRVLRPGPENKGRPIGDKQPKIIFRLGQPQPVADDFPLEFGTLVLQTQPYQPPTFNDYIRAEIGEMAQVCSLTQKQVKRLRLAAKGVVQRSQRQSMDQGAVRNEQMVGGWKLPQTAKHRALLAGSGLWTKTVKRTLTPEQLKRWRTRKPDEVVRTPVRSLPTLIELKPEVTSR